MRVLVFGTYDAGRHPRVGVLIEGLRAHGHEVVEVNEPLQVSTDARVAMLRQPWRLPGLAWRLARIWSTLARQARTMPSPDVVLVGFLGHFDVLVARRLFRKVPIVLDHLMGAEETARDRGVTGGPVIWATRLLDRFAVRAADLVLVDTDEHRWLTGARRAEDTLVVPVGAPVSWFAAHRSRETKDDSPLRVVFFGTYTPLQGAAVIGAAARLLADDPIEITMIGHGQDYAETVRSAGSEARIAWIQWVPYDQLPKVVASHDVCLGIFGTGPKARSVVPNKVYQGMAAGLAIVTSDTEPQRRAVGEAARLVPPGDAAALAELLRSLAANRDELDALQRRSTSLAASTMTAEAVATPLEQRLRLLVGVSQLR